MKSLRPLILILLSCSLLSVNAPAQGSWMSPRSALTSAEFHIWTEVKEAITLPIPQRGYFWTQWEVATNDAPQVAMEGFNSVPQTWGPTNFIVRGYGFLTTNFTAQWYCDKEHLDRSEQTVTKYISSNLVSFLVWRGQTNRHVLETIPITNIVHHWHWDKKQVWTD